MSGMPGYCTLHGAFLDVTVFSDDSLIARASDYRVEQSLTIAKRLGVEGLYFIRIILLILRQTVIGTVL